MKSDYQSGVFHRPELTITSLKESAFLWEHIYIYHSHLEGVQDEDRINSLIELFENNVLKIVLSAEDKSLKQIFQHDYKYQAFFNQPFVKYILENEDRINVTPEFPENWEEIVKKSAAIDEKDKKAPFGGNLKHSNIPNNTQPHSGINTM